MQTQAGNITRLLAGWRDGDAAALDELLPLIRAHLRRIANRQLAREPKNHTIQPSSLVQEAFVRLLPGAGDGWQNRQHFFSIISRVMRHVLVDHARARLRVRRGGGAVHLPLDESIALSTDQVEHIAALDLALDRLAGYDVRKSSVFEMRFFGGLSVEEVAEALGVAPNTVIRDWSFARAWLRRELGMTGDADFGTLAPH